MALFDKGTPALRLPYRYLKNEAPTPRWVLWPVFAWRVVAPVPKERSLNLFQKAVLGLARAHVVRVVDVAERLLIAPDLAGLVVQELQHMDMVDHAGSPSPRGLRSLDDIEDDPPDEARVGHVLSDPFTGKLWPRFLPGDLPLWNVESNEDGWPVLLSGSAGKPWKGHTFSMLPSSTDSVVMARPSAREVLRAARRHRRQRDFDEAIDNLDVPRLDRVSFVDEEPQPYMLALRVRRHHSGDWMVEDPFVHGEAVDLRTQMEERFDTQPGLRSWLAPLVGIDPTTPTLAHLQTEAAWKVEERLTLAIRQHSSVLDRLVAMQRAFLEASLDDAPADKLDDVLVKAQRAVERTLHTIYAPYQGARPPLYADLAVSDKELNRRHLDTIASELGFQAPLPDTLTSVRRGKVQHAEQWMTGSLRPLVVLALLCAGRDDGHPLHRAARSHPDILHRFDALATARDSAAHDSTDHLLKVVGQHVETTFLAVELLLLSR